MNTISERMTELGWTDENSPLSAVEIQALNWQRYLVSNGLCPRDTIPEPGDTTMAEVTDANTRGHDHDLRYDDSTPEHPVMRCLKCGFFREIY